MADEKLQELIQLWMKWDQNESSRQEIQALVDKKDWEELQRRLGTRLEFGTAGEIIKIEN